MYLFFAVLLLLGLFVRGEILIEQIPVLSQLNASTEKLISQKFTDILPQVPLLASADDFTLPANISTNITIFRLAFSIVRILRDTDPDSITVALMYNDPKIEGPGAVFFTKTVRSPNNPPRWHNDSLGVPELISLNITQDEASGADPTVLFDFQNETFLPRQTRLWLSVYVTGLRSYETEEPHAENALFWCITSEEVNQTWQGTALYNAPFFFRDAADIIGKGFVNWTNASVVQPLLGMNTQAKNMAWSLDLLGVAPSTWLEVLQGLSAKQVVTVIVCVIVGLAVFCMCVVFICKRCRRCKRKLSLPMYDLGGTLYKPVVDIQLEEMYTTSTTNTTQSEVSLEYPVPSSSSNTIKTTPSTTLKNSPSGKYLQQATQVPVKTRTTNQFDKDK